MVFIMALEKCGIRCIFLRRFLHWDTKREDDSAEWH